jgi:hypothetical protein
MKWQPRPHERSISRDNASERQGTMLVAVLVCLLVVMGMMGTVLQGALRAHRQLHRERDLRQTELLLQAGHDRALSRLESETNYRGETWNLPAETFANQAAGRVTIEISPAKGQSAPQAQVVAEYPLTGESSIRRTRTFQIPPSRPNEQE